MDRSREERARQAERNRRSLLAAEGGALRLLLERRADATRKGTRLDRSLEFIAENVESETASAVADARLLSRLLGVERLRGEFGSLGVAASIVAPPEEVARDFVRSQQAGRSYGARWFRKASESAAAGSSVNQAVDAANTETRGSLERIGVTESSDAFNTGRGKAVAGARVTGLLKVWDATLDRRTCPICSAADGTIVGAHEPFPQGEPGTIHPWDRCTWTLLRSTEDEHGTLIEPIPARGANVQVPETATGIARTTRGEKRALKRAALRSKNVELSKSQAQKLGAALDSLERDGGKATRNEVRAVIKQRLKLRANVKGRKQSNALTTEAAPGLTGDFGGFYSFKDGLVGIDRTTLNRARSGLGKIASGSRDISSEELDGMRVLFHEELHGFSPINAQMYEGKMLRLEEAQTELLARKMVRDLTGVNPPGAYGQEVQSFIDLFADAKGDMIGGASKRSIAESVAIGTRNVDPHADAMAAMFSFNRVLGQEVGNRGVGIFFKVEDTDWWAAKRLVRSHVDTLARPGVNWTRRKDRTWIEHSDDVEVTLSGDLPNGVRVVPQADINAVAERAGIEAAQGFSVYLTDEGELEYAAKKAGISSAIRDKLPGLKRDKQARAAFRRAYVSSVKEQLRAKKLAD